MALQIWLPYTNNINNQGAISLPSLSYGSISTTTGGKLGNCSSGYGIYHLSSDPTPTNNWTVSTWVYRTSAFGQYNDIISCKNTSDSEDGLFYISIVSYGTYLNCGVNGSSSGCTYTYTFSTNTWYHIAASYDGSTVRLYLNGNLVATQSRTATLVSGLNLGINTRSSASAGTSGYGDCGFKLNDYRLYNETLSDKLIKEIAKGLVIHFPFNDSYIESTTNLQTTVDISNNCYNGATSKYNYGTTTDIYKTLGTFQGKYCVKVYCGTDGLATYPYPFIDNITPAAGAYKTVSFDYYPTSLTALIFYSYNTSCTWSWRNGNLTGTSGQVTVELNKWNHIEMTIYNSGTGTAGAGYMRIGTGSHTSSTSNYWLFANIQIEVNNHATGYAGVGGTRTSTTDFDTSGLKNNSTISSVAPTYTYTSPRNNACYYFGTTSTGFDVTNLPTSGLANSYTFSWWGKVSSWSSVMFWGFSNGNRLNYYHGLIWNTGDGDTNPFYTSGTTTTITAPSTGTWHHFAVTGNGSQSLLYVDGVLYGVAKTYKAVTGTAIHINGWDTGTSYKCAGYMSDFRIYATCLSAADIKLLYNSPIEVTNTGSLVTQGEVVEI